MVTKTPDTNILVFAAIQAEKNRKRNKEKGTSYPVTIDSVLRSKAKLFGNCNLVYTSEVLREAPDVFRSKYPRLGGYISQLINSNPPVIYPSNSTKILMRADSYYYTNDALIYLICLDNEIDELITNNAQDFKRLNQNRPEEFPKKFSIILAHRDLSGYNRKESIIVRRKNESYARYILRWIKSIMID